jgi:hypothetical protein
MSPLPSLDRRRWCIRLAATGWFENDMLIRYNTKNISFNLHKYKKYLLLCCLHILPCLLAKTGPCAFLNYNWPCHTLSEFCISPIIKDNNSIKILLYLAFIYVYICRFGLIGMDSISTSFSFTSSNSVRSPFQYTSS